MGATTSIDRDNLPKGFDPSLSANFPAHFYERGAIMIVGCLLLLLVAQRVFQRFEGRIPEQIR